MPDLTPAETLRKAAALMRERAESATPGPWQTIIERGDWFVSSTEWGQVTTGVHSEPGVSDLVLIERDQRDAAYIASMHPMVALALADWLDSSARDADDACQLPGGEWRFSQCDSPAGIQSALKIANVFLGEVSNA